MKRKGYPIRSVTGRACLSCAVVLWLTCPVFAEEKTPTFVAENVYVTVDAAEEAAKYESQSTVIITKEEIAAKQAKSVEDIIFDETGVTRSVDAMGRVGVSIRGAEPRHTLILVDGQPVMGDFAKYTGQGDELQRLGTENVERIEIIRGSASAKYGSDAIGGVVNVVTRRPSDTPGMSFNVEGRRAKSDSDIFPYQNVFLRADTGDMNGLRMAVYGGKREVMPAYSKETFLAADPDNGVGASVPVRNSLRYYGNIRNVGVSASYDIDERNRIDINLDRINEDMERYVKHSNALSEPQQIFKRNLDRNTYRMSYTGNNGGSTDWKVDVDYSKLNEDDVAVSTMYGNSRYEGKNTLNNIDDVEHKQFNIKASANTQINDAHLLTYGFGMTNENGRGSRLKNAPTTTTRYIDPWDYDKNLYSKGGTGAPLSLVHDHAIVLNSEGIPYYDQDYERYGIKDADGNNIIPIYTYEDFIKYGGYGVGAPADVNARLLEFGRQLQNENGGIFMSENSAVNHYYLVFGNDGTIWNGRTFKEEYESRHNRQTIGEADIRRRHFFLQDTWQANERTILSPILRFDHSNLFGLEATFNMGVTHNLGGKANRRLKANVGTGYTEPGMGELYYSWEMYPGSPVDLGEARLGYYFIGNPNLQPETSFNTDIGFEAESGNTSYRVNAFHNRIRNYMSTYFTGYLMDFYPDETENKWLMPPDMIYSFKNIGKAEITGFEAEINRNFNDHWSAKLGYTYLHAVNKSDPNMPRQLLDKPQHKVDVGVTYKNNGWTASLWGNYYIRMLDSNSIANNGNYVINEGNDVRYNFAVGGQQTYERKTFSVWNLLLRKDLGGGSSAYIGVDNVFNHRDDDRALQERVYKVGVNLKFGSDGRPSRDIVIEDGASAAEVIEASKKDWFVRSSFDLDKAEGVEIIGDYRMRWNAHTGEIQPSEFRVTTTGSIGTAYKNYLEAAGHGFEQRLRIGFDARIGANTDVTVLGSASGMSGLETGYDASESKGLNHQRLDRADVTRHASKWDFSVGRLSESMGVTGYWFDDEYDGARAVWTSGRNQVRIGYGDFGHSTGIADSAYTHAAHQTFMRPPTKEEWLGIKSGILYWDGLYSDNLIEIDGFETLYQKLLQAVTAEEQKAVLDEYLSVVKEDAPTVYQTILNLGNRSSSNRLYINTFSWYKITIADITTGDVINEYLANADLYSTGTRTAAIPYADMFDTEKLEAAAEAAWNSVEAKLETGSAGPLTINTSFLIAPGRYKVTSEFYGYGEYRGDELLKRLYTWHAVPLSDVDDGDFVSFSKEEAKARAVESLWNNDARMRAWSTWFRHSGNLGSASSAYSTDPAPSAVASAILGILTNTWQPEQNSSLPLHLLEAEGILIPQEGTVLQQDVIPAIDRAAFVQFKHQIDDRFGVQAWYLRSMNDAHRRIVYAKGSGNDIYEYSDLAQVFGIGAVWRVNDRFRLSVDWGRNMTDFGRMMNGETRYAHAAGTSDFSIEGRDKGGAPTFGIIRLDVGHADIARPGSWGAFADYKYFKHGSFFGGNGSGSVPDRYFDGIKSFTVGGSYVPMKDFLLEAFYTFDARGIGRRDTLYGGERFKLGDYTRVQMTYRF